ncbi:MAG: PD-(D/E)XK nuclease family protein, partial [Asticcacaulis sp.]|nr:PD-(D/E)XK nuclease family protein [Asticcacaulis sp.]
GEGRTGDVRTLFAVGDEKQSIYGFQGADPREFLEARHRIGRRAVAGGATFVEPDLIDSWRTLPDILGFVDAVFETPELANALNFSADVIRHVARRREGNGLVELWPMVRPMTVVEATADEDDQAALDDPGRNPPSQRLARQIAATVRSEIDTGRAVYDKAQKRLRPVHAGDVLILVRKRDHLFEHIIRELKMAGVAVSGADRLKLGDHIAFQDLRALLRFCLQPQDSLSLACVLRSPLCDLNEGDLFALAHGRENRSLWTALRAHPAREGPIDEARIFLSWAHKIAWQLTAFDFLGRVLNRRDLDGRSYRQRFLTRLGDECDDVLEETLALALKGEGVGASGLSACLDLFEYHASEIKREQEEGGRAVRVMTVHGSKGLEAPWVIVPIGPQYGARRDDLLLSSEDGDLYLCAGGRKGDIAAITAIRQARALRDDQESLRLLYVAMTRARDRLTLCGYVGSRAPAAGNFPSWYDLAEAAFARLPDPYLEVMKLAAPFDDGELVEDAPVRLFGLRSEALTAEAMIKPPETPLPAFANAAVNEIEVETERWAAISQMGDEDRSEDEQAPSPLQRVGALGRYRRGNLIHKLFEILPEVSPAMRGTVAARYLGRQDDLTEAQRSEMAGAVMAVLEDARFAEAFGPQSRPEVALAGQIGVNARGEAIMLSGRIDRLVVTADRVLIIDYKSNRPA